MVTSERRTAGPNGALVAGKSTDPVAGRSITEHGATIYKPKNCSSAAALSSESTHTLGRAQQKKTTIRTDVGEGNVHDRPCMPLARQRDLAVLGGLAVAFHDSKVKNILIT